jgi:signal transduction histidine kinase
VARVFLSHSSRDSRQAAAVKAWLSEQEPGLAEEIYLDLDSQTGIRPGERWKQALQRANARCEAVICLLSEHWLNSYECEVEFRYAETLNKTILVARLEPVPDTNITSEWQRCDLFAGHGPTSGVDIGDAGGPVVLDSVGLRQLLDALRGLGIGAEHFQWPPSGDPDRAPYRGWAPLEEADAAVFFGRDAQILRGLDVLRGMRSTGVESLFVVLGPSGAGKSSFLRAGLLPRLRRDDRRFVPLPIVRPERAVLTGELGLAHAIHQLRTGLGLRGPLPGQIKNACHPEHVEQVRGWLDEARQAARSRLLDVVAEQPPPTLVLPVDQAEELFNPGAGPEAPRFLEMLAALVEHGAGLTPAMIVAVTIRADRYEALQIAPELRGLETALFDQLKPMPPAGYKEVISGPAGRAAAAGRRLTVEPALVERLLAETAEGADALPLLALTLERLYRDFGDSAELTIDQYEAMGGLAQIVQNEVDTLLAADPEERQSQLGVLHGAFIPWLATINPDGNEPMRRLGLWDDLPPASYVLIQSFVDKRLLVKDTRNGQTVVEVALESLLRQWRELAAWLCEEGQDLKDADNLERAAYDWQASGRDRAWLLGGTRLADAEALAAKPGFRDRLDPTGDFLRASRELEIDRTGAENQRTREKLLALGQLSAGLTHQLDNPAAAAARAVADLRDGLGKMRLLLAMLADGNFSPEALRVLVRIQDEAAEQVAKSKSQELTVLEAADREEHIGDWLDDHGINGAGDYAPTFVEAGLDTDWLERISASVDDVDASASLRSAIGWLKHTIDIELLMNQIAEASKKVSALLAGARQYSQQDRGHQAADVHELLDSTLIMFDMKIGKDTPINLVKEYEMSVPELLCYPADLNQVWTNIIDNAIYAMGGKGTLTMRTMRENDDMVRIEICDNGPGIPADIVDRIFTPFFTTKPVGEGTGLGLDLVWQIVVKKHRGALRVQSKPGDTRFIVLLPLQAPAPDAPTPMEISKTSE